MRSEKWEMRLHEAMQEARSRQFEYGEWDCATFAFDVRYRLIGIDTAAHWRGKYSTELGAARMLRRLGCESVEALATKHLGKPLASVKLAQRGDIVLADDALGVCIGAQVAMAGDGLVFRRLTSCEKAWRVE